MLDLLARRAVLGMAALFVLVTVLFFLVEWLIPFDYAFTLTTELGTEGVQQLRENLGLERPAYVRYFEYLGNLARGSLGTGFDGSLVGADIRSALPTTLLIFGVGAVFAFLLGTWLGRIAAWQRNVVGGGLTGVSILLYTAFPPLLVFLLVRYGSGMLSGLRRLLEIPIDSFRLWQPYLEQGFTQSHMLRIVGVGLFISLVAAIGLRAWGRQKGWRMVPALAIPSAFVGVGIGVWALGVGDLAVDATVLRAQGSVLSPLIQDRGTEVVSFLGEGQGSPLLTAFAFLLLAYGEVMFVMRVGMGEEMREDYVLTARAKGAPEHQVRDRHVARNAILPAVSRFFMGVPWMLTGLIIIEWELAVSGLSTLFFNAVRTVNTPVIMGTLIGMGILGLVIWLALEMVHAALDPRIRRRAGRHQ
jgi:ABC-type dipeptide/oligopeptide/nickel transport system permease component